MNNPPTLTQDRIDAMTQHVQDSFRAVRTIILEGVGTSLFNQKDDGSPVTDIDKIVEKHIIEAFQNTFPEIPIYGEETGYGEDLPPIYWLIDPIDGTASYIKNIPVFTCMAVLIADEAAQACVIYNPTSDTMYTAQKNKGAYKNGIVLDLSQMPLPHIAYCKKQHTETLSRILEPAHVSCSQAPTGAGNGFAMVAEGTAAARFQINAGGYIHDYAPGALLVSEAGGSILPLISMSYTYKTKSFIACHPDLTAILLEAKHAVAALEETAS